MKNNNGFSLVEMLVALSLTMMLVVTALPIYQLLQTEKSILDNRLAVQSSLHDLLLDKLYDGERPTTDKIVTKHLEIPVLFTSKNGIVEGCAQWKNEKEQTEKLCLHGIQEQS